MYYILFYDYVENVLERRGPLREKHLGLAKQAHERGELVLAGALSDPVDQGVLVWNVEDRSTIEAFAKSDPYVTGGIVENWRIRPWNVVIGA
ncbi:MAG: YciI-like protein [Longimicrobiales bacterium]